MIRRIVLAIGGAPFLGAVVALSVPAVDKPAADLRAQVQQLVRQLMDADSEKQDAAARALVELGPDVLPWLPGADDSLSDAQKKHLRAVRAKLQEAQLQKELAPKLVTLQGSMPLARALKELERQTGLRVADARRLKDPVELNLALQGVTFWQALDALAKEADARVSLYQPGGAVALVSGPYREVPISYHGLFRLAIRRVTAIRDLDTDTHVCFASMEVAWEPRFRPFLLETRPQALVVHDDRGRDLPVPEDAGGRYPVDNRTATVIEVHLPAVPRSTSRLGLLKGSVVLIGPSSMVDFTFDTLDQIRANPKDARQTRQGVTVRVSKLTLASDHWTVEMALDYPADGPKFESFESWLVNNEIYLQKASGDQRFPNNGGYSMDSSTSNRAVVSYHFVDEPGKGLMRGKPGDWKLVYRSPGNIVEVPVPFAFKDILLP